MFNFGFTLFFMLFAAFMIANQCYVKDAHIPPSSDVYRVAEASKRKFSVPGPMVVTEFSPNSFVYELQRRIGEEINKIIDQEVNYALKRSENRCGEGFCTKFREKRTIMDYLVLLG